MADSIKFNLNIDMNIQILLKYRFLNRVDYHCHLIHLHSQFLIFWLIFYKIEAYVTWNLESADYESIALMWSHALPPASFLHNFKFIINFYRFYVFVCSTCNHGKEFVRRLEMKWVDLVHLMLYNLTVYNAKKYYDLDTVIIPYANDNWLTLQLPPRVGVVNIGIYSLPNKLF